MNQRWRKVKYSLDLGGNRMLLPLSYEANWFLSWYFEIYSSFFHIFMSNIVMLGLVWCGKYSAELSLGTPWGCVRFSPWSSVCLLASVLLHSESLQTFKTLNRIINAFFLVIYHMFVSRSVVSRLKYFQLVFLQRRCNKLVIILGKLSRFFCILITCFLSSLRWHTRGRAFELKFVLKF